MMQPLRRLNVLLRPTILSRLAERAPGQLTSTRTKLRLPASHPLTSRSLSTSAQWRTTLLRHTRQSGRRYNSNSSTSPKTPTPPSNPVPGPPKAQGMSARLKELSKKYGWAAVGVYLGLSALDFPFCFLAVRLLGAERVAEAEHFVVDKFWAAVGAVVPSLKREAHQATEEEEREGAVEALTAATAEAGTKGAGASIWTQLLLAYGVHKSLIFFRVPLTAAVTPNIVKYLRKRGWKIGPSTM